jgi:hypothetical protein
MQEEKADVTGRETSMLAQRCVQEVFSDRLYDRGLKQAQQTSGSDKIEVCGCERQVTSGAHLDGRTTMCLAVSFLRAADASLRWGRRTLRLNEVRLAFGDAAKPPQLTLHASTFDTGIAVGLGYKLRYEFRPPWRRVRTCCDQKRSVPHCLLSRPLRKRFFKRV